MNHGAAHGGHGGKQEYKIMEQEVAEVAEKKEELKLQNSASSAPSCSILPFVCPVISVPPCLVSLNRSRT
jgi:hypothetical protein